MFLVKHISFYALLVSRGRSIFFLLSPRSKRPKLEERKEVEIIENEDDLAEIQLLAEISNLQSKIKEYKEIQIEDSKYKEIVQSLVEKGVINKDGEELMKF